MPDPSPGEQDAILDGRAAATLLDNHRAFLRYLERRVGSREAAEDILQDAFVRNIARVEDVPDEGVVPWFYRVLRNAAIDRHRRQQVADRALEAFALEVGTTESPAPDLRAEICACVGRLAGTLKPEYAEALQAVDVEGVPVKDFAGAVGISASNAGVRLFRARQALRHQVVRSCGTCADHGCFDCSCGKPPRTG